ncbi:MAG: bifunctional riboflavin kinase/FAD synthetase [Clostridia bacterium]|nr:bifunctional riboflavin kinase/FAD synthetase [Clostridia bacterium]
MIITDNLKKINKNEKKLLILGDFDGVHKGHVSLIEKSVEIAKAENLSCCVYTFKVNTKLLTRGNVSFLTTDEEKNGIFGKYGLDCVYYEDFESVKNMEPREFCKYLAEYFGAKRIVCGENFSFGKNASAGSNDLKRFMKEYSVETDIMPMVKENGKIVSSTLIRSLVSDGRIEKANELLGYPYFVNAPVVHGKEFGRKLGFPTINQLEYGNKTKLKHGVYACICTIGEKKYPGVANVGVKPTVEKDADAPVTIETHIIDCSEDLYGKTVKIEFYKFLREEKKFSSLDELKENIMNNIMQTKEYFKGADVDER